MNQKGFTLVEVSVVIVAISLLFGAVIAGENLIRAATIRAQVAQMQQYKIGVNEFRLKYNYFPGDFPLATQFFPAGSPAVDGNGNHLVEDNNGRINVARARYNGEIPQVFVHLGLSGVVSGTFDGGLDLGSGIPKSKINPNKAFVLGQQWLLNTGGVNPCDFNAGNLHFVLSIGQLDRLPNLGGADNPLTPEGGGIVFENTHTLTNPEDFIFHVFEPFDIRQVDQKIDDGRSTTGELISINPYGALAGPCHDTGEYRASFPYGACRTCYAMF